ncbi:hypothetical protein DKG75_14530 [Zavarzinia compransoris]|uniref:DUF2029 domain-containing protein n=2 Tax=Zavarzinia compransoris TaxID=1264899 RepID=A0A317DZ45_9PROT|nr:hypothetical protein DKG75_14530 [Zavarzinia compransoris]
MNRAEKTDFLCALLLLLAGILGAGAGAAFQGQDGGWDLRNYHWYVPHALLSGRLGVDVLPAFMGPTFHNPLIDVPFYLAARAFGPLAASIALGAVQGANILPLYLIARRLLPEWPRAFAALAALAGIGGAMNIGLLGSTAGDNLLSLFVLGAVAALLAGPRWLLLAGFLAGAGFGLKTVLAPFVFGIGLTVILFAAGRPGGFRRVLGFALAGIAGTALTGGWWMALLYAQFGNPLMPYFNDIFQSPYVPALTFSDPGFTARLPWPRVQLPLLAGIVDFVAAEQAFTDLRLPLGCAAALVLLAGGLRRRGAGFRLAVLVLATLVPWSIGFAIYRYVLAFEMLGPVLVLAALALLPRRGAMVLGLAALVALAAITRPPVTERVAFGADVTGVAVPPIADPARTVVLMAGLTPAAFVIPAFPPEIRFLRFDGYWIDPGETAAGYARAIRAALAAPGVTALILHDPADRARVDAALPRFLPGATLGDCAPVPHHFAAPGTNWGHLVLCRVEGWRQAPGPED